MLAQLGEGPALNFGQVGVPAVIGCYEELLEALINRDLRWDPEALPSVASFRDGLGAVRALDLSARTCPCASALATALITRPEHVPAETKKKLAPIIGKYMSV